MPTYEHSDLVWPRITTQYDIGQTVPWSDHRPAEDGLYVLNEGAEITIDYSGLHAASGGLDLRQPRALETLFGRAGIDHINWQIDEAAADVAEDDPEEAGGISMEELEEILEGCG